MNNKKIVFLAISSNLGGAERSLLDLVAHSKDSNLFAPLVILPSSGPLGEKLKDLNIETIYLKLPSFFESVSRRNKMSFLLFMLLGLPSFLTYTWRLRRLLKSHSVHSVHSTGIKNHILCCWLSTCTSLLFFIHLRDFINSPILGRFFALFSTKKNIYWMSASQAITEKFKWPIPVFYDGLSEKLFFKNPSLELKKQLGLSEHSILIGHAAALTPWKGQMVFIEAAKKILENNPRSLNKFHFVIIGSPIYKTNSDKSFDQTLKDKVAALKLQDHIHFIPFIKNSREIYDNIDLFVHSSTEPEPFGRVILEALFCEKPVVAAGAGGVLEIMSLDSAKKFLHKPGNADSLAATIEKALAVTENEFAPLVHDAKTRFQADTCYQRQVAFLSEPH